MFGSLATICISFIWTSGIFLCLVILDNLCNLKCFPQHGAVTRPWLGSLRARCSFKKKKIENPNQNKKPSAVYSLQFNVWPHSPESLSFGSLVLNMLPKTTQAFFSPSKTYISFCPPSLSGFSQIAAFQVSSICIWLSLQVSKVTSTSQSSGGLSCSLVSSVCLSFFLHWCSGLINAAGRADLSALRTFTSGH